MTSMLGLNRFVGRISLVYAIAVVLIAGGAFAAEWMAPSRGVLLLTFDDDAIDSWLAQTNRLAYYGARVTFSPYGEITAARAEKLLALKAAGHTVGIHTLGHRNTDGVTTAQQIAAYALEQVKPQVDALAACGHVVRTIAYPNNKHTAAVDAHLEANYGIRHFRATDLAAEQQFAAGAGKDLAANDACFTPVADIASLQVVNAVGCAGYYGTDMDVLCAGIRRAAANNEVLAVFSHDIRDSPSEVGMKTEWLETILATAADAGVTMLGLDDLPVSEGAEPQPQGKGAEPDADGAAVPAEELFLPAGYTRLDYVQSSGSQYVDTGIAPDETTAYRLELQELDGQHASSFIFGSRIASKNHSLMLSWQRAEEASRGLSFAFGDDQWYAQEWYGESDFMTVEFAPPSCRVDGEEMHSFDGVGEWSNDNPLYVFAGDNNGAVGAPSCIRLRSCKIWKGGEIKRNLVPAKNASGRIGLYDWATGDFLTAQGGMELMPGPEAPSLTVAALPEKYGEPTPAYGRCQPAVGGEVTCSAPARTTVDGDEVVCVGHDLYTNATGSVSTWLPWMAADGNTVTFVQPACDVRLVWQWADGKPTGTIEAKAVEATEILYSCRIDTLGDGASSVEAWIELQVPGGVRQTVALGTVDAPTAFERRVSGLTGGTGYTARLVMSNDLGRVARSQPAVATTLPDTVQFAMLFGSMAMVTFSDCGVTGTLEDFPVCLRISESRLDGFRYADCAADGADLRFTDAKGDLLAFEIESWNPDGESIIWVKVPSLTTSTQIVCYWGADPDLIPVAPASTEVWTKYVGVWHLGSSERDASGRNASGVALNGTGIASGRDAGIAGDYYDFPNAAVNCLLPNSFSNLTDIARQTVSGWIRPRRDRDLNGASGVRVFTTKKDYSNTDGYELYLAPNKIQCRTGYGGSNPTVVYQPGTGTWGTLFDYGEWTHLAAAFDGTVATVYGNGMPLKSDVVNAMADTDRGLSLGNYSGVTADTCRFTGAMDEVRVYDGVASAEWLKAEFETVASDGFAVFGVAMVPESGTETGLTVSVFPSVGGARLTAYYPRGVYATFGECSLSFALARSAASLREPTEVLATIAGGERFETNVTALVEWGSYVAEFVLTPQSGSPITNLCTFTTLGTGVDMRNYTHRVPISFPGFVGSETLGGFPALVRVSADRIDDFDYADCVADGSDIRFVDRNGTILPHEIDTWNPSGESLVWVKVSSLDAAAEIDMVYGVVNPARALPNDPTAVWSSYAAVYHLNESLAESSGKGLAGSGLVAETNEVHVLCDDPLLGGCVSNAISGGIGLKIPKPSPYLSDVSVQTVSGWFRLDPDSAGQDSRLITAKGNWDETAGFEIITPKPANAAAARELWVRTKDTTSTVKSSGAVAGFVGGTWTHVAGCFDRTVVAVVVNGAVVGSGTVAEPVTDTSYASISAGGYLLPQIAGRYAGLIDEIRVRNASSSAAWLANEYATVSDRDYARCGAAVSLIVEGGAPSATATLVETGCRHVRFDGRIIDSGEGALSCTVTFAYGPAGGALDNEAVFAEGIEAGSAFTGKTLSLEPATTYAYELRVENELGVSATVSEGVFTTEPLPEDAGEAPIVTAGAVTAEGVTATVNWNLLYAGAGQTDAELSFAWGYAPDALDYTNALAASATEGAGSLAIALPRSGRLCYCRIVAANGGGVGVTSLGVFTTAATPAVDDGPADAPDIVRFALGEITGDGVAFTGTLGDLGADAATATVSLLLGTTDDLLALTVAADGIVPDAEGNFSGQLTGLTPGTTYFLSCRAVNDLGKVDTRTPVQFATPAATALAQSTATTLGMDGPYVVVPMPTFYAFGAGQTILWLYESDEEGVMHECAACEPVVLDAKPGADDKELFRFMPSVYDEAHVYQIVCSNYYGGWAWGTSLAKSGQFAASDNTQYAWRSEYASGRWDDPAVWEPNNASASNGYPRARGSGVVFGAGCRAVVMLGEGEIPVGNISYGASDVSVTLKGVSSNATHLVSGGALNLSGYSRNTMTFDGIDAAFGQVRVANGRLDANNTLVLTNAANLAVGFGELNLYGTNFTLIVTGGSVLDNQSTGNMRLGSPGSRMVVDDGIVRTAGMFDAPGQDWGPVTVVFRGAQPHLDIAKRSGVWQPDSTAWVTYEFSLPEEPYESAVISSVGNPDAGYLFGYTGTSFDGTGKEPVVEIKLDRKAPALLKHKGGTFPLIYWDRGIDKAKFRLDERSYIQYIWSDSVDPADPTSAPRRLSVKYKPMGMMFIIK